MSNPTRICSLLLVATLASACWPGALGSAPADEPPPLLLTEGAPSEPATEVQVTVERDSADNQAGPAVGNATKPTTARQSAAAGYKPARRATPSRSARRRTPDRCPAGTFFDPRGECWSCPSGYHRTIFPVTAKNACEKRLQIKHRPVAGKMKATGIIKTDCRRGWFLHQLSGVCYRCPSGFKRTVFGINSKQACERWEGPLWTRATFRKKLSCGDAGNRACTLSERVPSCDAGLKENAKAICVPLLPGETPFLAGLAAKSKAIGDLGTEACHALLRPLPAPKMPFQIASMSSECRHRATIGFACELPGMVDQVSAIGDYAKDFSVAWSTKPCSEWPLPARPLCAATSATLGDAPQVLSCLGAAIQAGALGQLEVGEVCEAGGQIAFQIAVLRKMKLKGKKGKESRLDQLKRLLVNSGTVAKGMADVSQPLDRLAQCRILD